MAVSLVTERNGALHQAVVVDVSVAGAGLEVETALTPGEKLDVSFVTPTLWDPLVVPGTVIWSKAGATVDARGRSLARAGVAFEYPSSEDVLAMLEMLDALE